LAFLAFLKRSRLPARLRLPSRWEQAVITVSISVVVPDFRQTHSVDEEAM
jgi:hypothetical protein